MRRAVPKSWLTRIWSCGSSVCSDLFCHHPPSCTTVAGSSASSVLMVSVPFQAPPCPRRRAVVGADSLVYRLPGRPPLRDELAPSRPGTRPARPPSPPPAGSPASSRAVDHQRADVSGPDPVFLSRTVAVSWTTLFGGWRGRTAASSGSRPSCMSGGWIWMRLKTSRSGNGPPSRFSRPISRPGRRGPARCG